MKFLQVLIKFFLALFMLEAIAQDKEAEMDAGEIFEEAMLKCSKSDFYGADELFDAIIFQLNPPDSVINIIMSLKKERCGFFLKNNPRSEFNISAGYDSNVTQGVAGASMILGGAEFIFDSSHAPKSSSYLESGLQRVWGGSGMGLVLKGSLRTHSKARSHDQANFSATIKGLAEKYGVSWATTYTSIWLDGRYYYTSFLFQGDLAWGEQREWKGISQVLLQRYKTQESQSSNVYLLAIQRGINLGNGGVYLQGGWQWDIAQGTRAGGNREGIILGLNAYWPVDEWLLSSKWSYLNWTSSQSFLPGLVDVPRENSFHQWSIQGEKSMNDGKYLILSLSKRLSQDNLTIYSYKGWSFSVSMMSRF